MSLRHSRVEIQVCKVILNADPWLLTDIYSSVVKKVGEESYIKEFLDNPKTKCKYALYADDFLKILNVRCSDDFFSCVTDDLIGELAIKDTIITFKYVNRSGRINEFLMELEALNIQSFVSSVETFDTFGVLGLPERRF